MNRKGYSGAKLRGSYRIGAYCRADKVWPWSSVSATGVVIYTTFPWTSVECCSWMAIPNSTGVIPHAEFVLAAQLNPCLKRHGAWCPSAGSAGWGRMWPDPGAKIGKSGLQWAASPDRHIKQDP